MRNLLKVGLRRLVHARERYPVGDRHASILAIAARKGGVGKTTTSVNLAAALARFHGLKVLLIDLDPQGHVSTALADVIEPGGGPLSAVLEEERGAEVLDAVTRTSIPGLDTLPADPRLAATEDLLGTRIGKEFILRDKLAITRTHYDLIVVDCPPNLGNLTLNGLVAADRVLVPCDPSPLGVRGVDALLDAVTTIAGRLNPEIDMLGVLLTRVDGRNTRLNETVLADVADTWGPAVLPVHIGIASALAKAQHAGQDIFAYEPNGRGARQYRALADLVVAELRAPQGIAEA